MQTLVIEGYLAADPSILSAQGSGRKRASFRVLETTRYRRADGEQGERTTGFNCVCFNETTAENYIAPYARKGRRLVMLEGGYDLDALSNGSATVLRLRGTAWVTDDVQLRTSFARGEKLPRTVIVLRPSEVYFQCARAVKRAGLWDGGDESAGLPTPGEILSALTLGEVGGKTYDAEWPERAARSMW